MKTQITIRCKLVKLTERKQQLLEREHAEAERLHGILRQAHRYGDPHYFQYKTMQSKLYSLHKADLLFADRKRPSRHLPLPSQSTRLIENRNRLAHFWLNIKCYGVKGGIWAPLRLGARYKQLVREGRLCDSKLIKRKNCFYAHLVYEINVPAPYTPKHIAGVDVGDKVVATVCGGWNHYKPAFYGREVRGIHRHYAWLRKRLGQKKLLNKIRQTKNKERDKVNTVLHQTSHDIVQEAKSHRAIIVLGNLKGLGNKDTGKGKRFNRIVNHMPYHALRQMIEYKALWAGVPVETVSERDTSKTCSQCGEKGRRVSQSQFSCPHCSLQLNADCNGARNIANRFLGQRLRNGALAYALNPSAPSEAGSTLTLVETK